MQKFRRSAVTSTFSKFMRKDREWEMLQQEIDQDLGKFRKLLGKYNMWPDKQPNAKAYMGEGHALPINILKKGEDVVIKAAKDYPAWVDEIAAEREPSLTELVELQQKKHSKMAANLRKKLAKKNRRQQIKDYNEKDLPLEE